MSSRFYVEVTVYEVVGRYSGDKRALVKDEIECESIVDASNLWDDYLKWAGYDYRQKEARRIVL